MCSIVCVQCGFTLSEPKQNHQHPLYQLNNYLKKLYPTSLTNLIAKKKPTAEIQITDESTPQKTKDHINNNIGKKRENQKEIGTIEEQEYNHLGKHVANEVHQSQKLSLTAKNQFPEKPNMSDSLFKKDNHAFNYNPVGILEAKSFKETNTGLVHAHLEKQFTNSVAVSRSNLMREKHKKAILMRKKQLPHLNEEKQFSPVLRTSIKAGRRRSVARPSMVMPLFQKKYCTFNLNIISMFDTKSAVEANIGFGYRHLLKHFIFGVYGFYDFRRTPNKNLIPQLNIGAEVFSKNFEMRFNIYLPKDKKFILSKTDTFIRKTYSSYYTYSEATRVKYETALKGLDFEIGGHYRNIQSYLHI